MSTHCAPFTTPGDREADTQIAELVDRARDGHGIHSGLAFRVPTAAVLHDGTQELRHFDPPLRVRVGHTFDPLIDVTVWTSPLKATTCYDVECLEPERLAARETLLHVQGPTYRPGAAAEWAAELELGLSVGSDPAELGRAIRSDVGNLLGYRQKVRAMAQATAEFERVVDDLSERTAALTELETLIRDPNGELWKDRAEAAEARSTELVRDALDKSEQRIKAVTENLSATLAEVRARCDDAVSALALAETRGRTLETVNAGLERRLTEAVEAHRLLQAELVALRHAHAGSTGRARELERFARLVQKVFEPLREVTQPFGGARERLFCAGIVLPGVRLADVYMLGRVLLHEMPILPEEDA
jgi:hypothetical protein